MLRPPLIDPATFGMYMQALGYAVSQVQELENAVAHYLILVFELKPGIARDEAETLLEKARRKTLGQLTSSLQTKSSVPEDLARALDEFVDTRNWLIHRSRAESRKQFYDPHRRAELIERIAEIGHQAVTIAKAFAEEIESEAHRRGITRAELEENAAAIMRGWVDA